MTWTKAKKIYVKDNLSVLDRVAIGFAEFLGTAVLLFIGCMGCNATFYASHTIPHLQISLTFGLAIMLSVQCFGHISGSHINPAVTVAAVILGHCPILHIPLYFFSQILGAIAGFALLKVFTAEADSLSTLCSPGPLGSGVSVWQGVGVECVATFILVMFCASVWDCRNSDKHDSLSVRLGLAVAVLAMAAGPYTGANMNPARSLGPALINGTWTNWWVWWLGPMAGGLLAGVLYRFVFSKEYETKPPTTVELMHLNDKA